MLFIEVTLDPSNIKYTVNLDHVRAVKPRSNGRTALTIVGGAESLNVMEKYEDITYTLGLKQVFNKITSA